MPTGSNRRSGRRLRADNLTIVWDISRVSFLGTIDAAQWIEAVTQTRPDENSPWVDVEIKPQLFGRVSENLHANLPHSHLELYVTFVDGAHEYGGVGLIKKRPDEFIQLYMDKGLLQKS